jgi:hypothetical protein
MLLGLVSTIILCTLTFLFSSAGEFGPVAALMLGLAGTCAALGGAIAMAWRLPRWQKGLAIFPAVLLPVLLYSSLSFGEAQSPEEQTKRHDIQIAIALDQYYTQHGAYPRSLVNLEPAFVSPLPEALTTQGRGWLYQADEDTYMLGFWYWPAKDGVEVCLYASLTRVWDCKFNNWGPFPGVTTPLPT